MKPRFYFINVECLYLNHRVRYILVLYEYVYLVKLIQINYNLKMSNYGYSNVSRKKEIKSFLWVKS